MTHPSKNGSASAERYHTLPTTASQFWAGTILHWAAYTLHWRIDYFDFILTGAMLKSHFVRELSYCYSLLTEWSVFGHVARERPIQILKLESSILQERYEFTSTWLMVIEFKVPSHIEKSFLGELMSFFFICDHDKSSWKRHSSFHFSLCRLFMLLYSMCRDRANHKPISGSQILSAVNHQHSSWWPPNTRRPEQNGGDFADDIYDNTKNMILRFHRSLSPRVQFLMSLLFQIMAFLRIGDRSLPEPMITKMQDLTWRHKSTLSLISASSYH